MDDLLDLDWVFLIGRPFNLFEVSVYQRWSGGMKELFGAAYTDNLFLEEHPHVVRRYVIKDQLENVRRAIKTIVEDKEKCRAMLEKALELVELSRKYVENSPFVDLPSAVDFLVQLALHATVFAYFSYSFVKDKELLAMVEKLRSTPVYPPVFAKILNPLAQEKVGDDYIHMTLSEVLAGDTSKVASRKHKRFVYAHVDGKDIVHSVDDINAVIERLENIHLGDIFKGQVAYPGKVTGKVRLVLTANPNVAFDEGDILVVVSSSPSLMPLIHKCGAMVSDEGGIMCHASIISRELKKPCIIGTKFATHSFKDGDIVEVDAHEGIVKRVNS